MDWLTQNKILPAVMTMSLGSYSTPESSRVAVDAVVAAGITVTVSAGNRGTPSCDKSYTFIRSAIGVAASDSTNTRASWSNYGECNAVFAPGVSINSCPDAAAANSCSRCVAAVRKWLLDGWQLHSKQQPPIKLWQQRELPGYALGVHPADI